MRFSLYGDRFPGPGSYKNERYHAVDNKWRSSLKGFNSFGLGNRSLIFQNKKCPGPGTYVANKSFSNETRPYHFALVRTY